MSVRAWDGTPFEMSVPVLIAGGGGCGLTAALAVRDAGVPALVVEADPVPTGSTAMSSGLVPAAGSAAQRAAGIDDDPATFAADIVAKTKGLTDPALAALLAGGSAATVDWLTDRHRVPLSLVTVADLPGHSRQRLHGTPNRSGGELMAALQAAALDAGVDLVTDARVATLLVDGDRVVGVEVARPDGAIEAIGCDALILATSGFAADAELVARHIPEIAAGVVHAHPRNVGDALRWGEALGAASADLGGYQGHGSLAHGHGLLVHWIVMGQGGIQVNALGERFASEARGYSEQAVDVLAQPGGVAWNIIDARIDALMQEFEEYRDARDAGAFRHGDDVAVLARATGLPEAALAATLAAVDGYAEGMAADPLGRRFDPDRRLVAPYLAVKVTGALFHTQGGLLVDAGARVLRPDGRALPNLFAGGGAARGVSGPGASGYLAGNGLLAATVLGRLAGESAARFVSDA